MDSQRKEYIEKIGSFLETAGSAPVAGRIVGFILTSDPPQATFYDLQEFLGASKSTISASVNTLLKQRVLDFITLPGDRKRYFVIKPDSWLTTIKHHSFFIHDLRLLIEEGLAIQGGKQEDFVKNMRDICELYKELEEELPKIIKRWEEKRKV
ncbi:MarR family transcriptional regulator [Cytophagaceae bacterium ABcell3]|nr:MarR family transcriptional regulator [Cytophagaceae bacterium ABcell3]